jgi:DNA-binding CsgD family transcriptional regulator
LLASVIYSDADPARRRRLHRRLADVVSDPEERARHLALGIAPPDVGVSAALEEAAGRAFERGAVDAAAELAEQALPFTPEDCPATAHRRLLTAADYLARSGRKRRARELVSDAYSRTEPGPYRAQIAVRAAWLGLWRGSLTISRAHEAIHEAEGDTALLADLHAVLAPRLMWSADLAAAADHAQATLTLAEELGDDARVAVGLVQSAWVSLFLGKGLDRERMQRALALEARAGNRFGDVAVVLRFLGFALAAMDELDEARRIFEAVVAEERRRGDTGVTWSLQMLAWVELLAGNWDRADALAAESLETAHDTEEPIQSVLALRALSYLAALRGEEDETRALAAEGLRLAGEAEAPLIRAELLGTLGFLELSLGDIETALSHLDEIARFAAGMGLKEPGILRFVPDRVEALIAAGDVETAASATRDLEERGRRLERASAIASAARCRGLIASARGDPETAITCLAAASDAAPLDQPFELGRTLLIYGATQRKARRTSEARRTLGEALAIFERLRAAVWTRKARAELARLGGRSTRTDRLTPTERQIADLVASGKSNHQVARILHLSPKTIEWNLSKIYKKLNVGSRTELAARLAHHPGE